MSLEYETRQQNSALTALKQRAAPPALTDQKPYVLYTMPVQTVERLEEVLQQTLALQKTIQASMAALATKESLEPLATAEQLHQWLEQTQALNQKTHRAMGEILSEMREERKRDGRQRDEFYQGALRDPDNLSEGYPGGTCLAPQMDPLHCHEFSSGGSTSVHSHVADADITDEVLQLLSRLEGNNDDYVLDATTRHSRGDRKALAKEQRKKIAMGHKEDDHEQGQQMM